MKLYDEGPVRPQQKARADKTDSSSNAVKTPNSDFLAATARFQAASGLGSPVLLYSCQAVLVLLAVLPMLDPHTPCWVYHFHQFHQQQLSSY